MLARVVRNRRLGDALHQQAFCALRASPAPRGPTTMSSAPPAPGTTVRYVSSAIALVGILHGCLMTHPYDEHAAWAHHRTKTNLPLLDHSAHGMPDGNGSSGPPPPPPSTETAAW